MAKRTAEKELAWLEPVLYFVVDWVDHALICPGVSGLPRDGFYLTRFNCKLPCSDLYSGDVATIKAVILACLIVETIRGG